MVVYSSTTSPSMTSGSSVLASLAWASCCAAVRISPIFAVSDVRPVVGSLSRSSSADFTAGPNWRSSTAAVGYQDRPFGDGTADVLVVVNTVTSAASVAGNQSIATSSVYAMTKKGLEMLARSLVSELSPLGITVNVIAPGATVTPRTLQVVPDYEPIWSQVIPTGRPAYPRDIANAALFFLSPRADHITGQTLIVDGGWSAKSPEPRSEFVDKTK